MRAAIRGAGLCREGSGEGDVGAQEAQALAAAIHEMAAADGHEAVLASRGW